MRVAILSVLFTFCALSVQLSDGCRSKSSSTTTTTTTAATTTIPTFTKGILIAGGNGGRKSVEVFIPDAGKSCSLPDLPDDRVGHTMDTLGNTPVICGGENIDQTSCLQFTPALGVWTNYATTTEEFKGHTSWVSSGGLVLMGARNGVSTEIVPTGAGNFSLVKDTKLACAITVSPYSTIITGGLWSWSSKVVARYNLQGHVEDLPEMNEGRTSHGCGFYYSGSTMVLIVAGGYGKEASMRSTEKLNIGGTAWTTIQPLPWIVTHTASVSMDNKIFLLGGDIFKRAEILAFDGEEWKEVGMLQKGRHSHAATKIDITDFMELCN